MTLLWIFLGAVAVITGVGVLAARLTDDRGQRASGEHTFRAAHPSPVTLPYMAAGSYASVQERHHGRTGEPHKDVYAATLHNLDMLDDIRTERTRNLHRPGAGATADNHRPVELNLAGQVSVAGPLPGELHLEDTAVDMSLHAAIRADVDGDYTGQITDRYFSQISLSKIFADLGITYTRTAVTS